MLKLNERSLLAYAITQGLKGNPVSYKDTQVIQTGQHTRMIITPKNVVTITLPRTWSYRQYDARIIVEYDKIRILDLGHKIKVLDIPIVIHKGTRRDLENSMEYANNIIRRERVEYDDNNQNTETRRKVIDDMYRMTGEEVGIFTKAMNA